MNLCDELEIISNQIELGLNVPDVVERLKILSYNHNQNAEIILLIDKLIERCEETEDSVSLITLYSLKITQIHHLMENMPLVVDLAEKIKVISNKCGFKDGITLYHTHKWYIAKFKGDKEQASKEINTAVKLIDQYEYTDQFIYHISIYTYAIEKWLEHHDSNSLDLLESCVPYFIEKGLNRSLAQTLSVLCIIYLQNNDHKKATETSKKILKNRDLIDKVSLDTKSIIYYLAGVGQLLQANLKNAELFFIETLSILEKIQNYSMYYHYYYIRTISHITTIQALLGNWDLAFRNMNKIENLLNDNNITNNFDGYSLKQIPHTLNLIKFYILSRMKDFETSLHKELIDSIYVKLEKQYSNPILLLEFIINADLKYEKLEKLGNSNFENLKRIRHIVDYEITKKTNSFNKASELSKACIQVLECRKDSEKETYLEKAFTDLLIARELFSNRIYEKIHMLLKKYENRLDKLEVLEFRIFMEAFIQVGLFKSGDPLGPALQYMAIKKCKQYGFSRLENKLLRYLDIQGNDTLKLMI